MNNQYNVHWYDREQTIIYAKYPTGWTWDDYYLIEQESHQLIDNDPRSDLMRVDIVADMINGIMPRGATWSHARSTMQRRKANVGLIVVVSENAFVHAITQMGVKLSAEMGELYQSARSVDEAIALIHKARSKATT
ncbi:MAG: hypothetical protein AAF125_15495 [Chloroflexota bacterium]